jgi:hypothetical protein
VGSAGSDYGGEEGAMDGRCEMSDFICKRCKVEFWLGVGRVPTDYCFDCVYVVVDELKTEVERLRAALTLACTPPWPVWNDPNDSVSRDALVEFRLRRAEAAKEQLGE